MARFSDAELDQIKNTVSLERLVESSGVSLTKQGDNLLSHCPFHDDKTPSLVVTPSKNLWNCLGACQRGGSVIDWVMLQQKVSFRHAVELLRNELYPLAADEKLEVPEKCPTLISIHSDNQEALQHVINYYHETLKQSPEALEYLVERGLNHPELIDRFKLGYANRTLGYRLPSRQSQQGRELRKDLQSLGVLRESGHEHFSGSLVIPILDEHDHITEIYGRKLLGNRLRAGTPIHTYLPGPHQGVFNIHAVKNYQEIILCESLIDALTFYANGFVNVTTSFGVTGFSEDLLTAFKAHDIKKVFIAYDRDEAGNKAAEKLSQQLSPVGIECFRVLFPKGMDANEYACQVKPADKSLDLVIRKAQWMCKGQGSVEESTGDDHSIVINELPAIDAPENKAAKEERAEVAAPLVPVEPSVVPEPIKADVKEHEIIINLGERLYRVRGLNKNLSYEQLKINLLIKSGEHFHVDTLDVYSARHRAAYIKQAAVELSLKEDIIKQDFGKLLLKLEELQDQQIQGTLSQAEKQPPMSDQDVKAAIAFLQSPDLLKRIVNDFDQLGVVGESTNKLVGYLAATSRKLDKPLAVMVQSSSAAGKSSLMEAILSLMPKEERTHFSAMTGQALFYMGEQDLKHKILSIAEEEGASQTAYALKLLQSEGEVSIASTGKNPTTGNLETQEYRVEGPVMLFSTTTAIDIDEELMNRCLVLSVDESREQTKSIHQAQRHRRTLSGLRASQGKQSLIGLHQNAQRLLRSLAVLNPFADQLTFLDDKTRTRRDHEKYLTLIDVIALLHQYQRPIKTDKHAGERTEYIEVTLQDIETANQLAHEVLGRTLDELPPQTRGLLQITHEMVIQQCQQQECRQCDFRFSRKMVRDYSGFTDFQIKKHISRLEDLEYLLIHKGRRGQSFEYELLYHGEGDDQNRFLMGLIDVAKLQSDAKKEPLHANKEPSKCPQRASKMPPSCTREIGKNFDKNSLNSEIHPLSAENALFGEKNKGLASHRSVSLLAAKY